LFDSTTITSKQTAFHFDLLKFKIQEFVQRQSRNYYFNIYEHANEKREIKTITEKRLKTQRLKQRTNTKSTIRGGDKYKYKRGKKTIPLARSITRR